jgi:ElaA protein
MAVNVSVHCAFFTELDTVTLYQLLKLRSDVFVVEQQDPYPDLDGRDVEPETVHLWYIREGESEPVAYLRICEEPDGSARIGRVVVAQDMRGTGLGRALMTEALQRIGDRRCVLSAQVHQASFYATFGFEAAEGPPYSNSLIPHLPMVRASKS